jgi:hypothetical protein
LIVLAALFASDLATADTLHVPAVWPTIQSAIDAASAGDTVQVAAGQYNERIDFLGKAIAVTGEGASLTAIIGTGLGGSVVRFMSGEGLDSVLSGFSIVHGEGELVEDPIFGYVPCGGGILVWGSGPTIQSCIIEANACWGGAGMCNVISSPDVLNCTFRGNMAEGHGGAIYNLNGSAPFINACLFEGNDAYWGGAMTNTVGSHAKIIGCSFIGNTVFNVGGAIYNRSYSSPIVSGCDFLYNIQSGNPLGSGGGMCTYGSGNGGGPCYPDVTDCLFEGNEVTGDGGGMANAYGAHSTVTNCVFRGNVCGRDGGGMASVGAHEPDVPSNATIESCVFEQNTSDDRGGGFFVRASEPVLINSVIRHNTASNGGGAAFFESEFTYMAGTVFCENIDEPVWGKFIDGGDNVYDEACQGDCPGDVDGDGMVGVDDILLVLSDFGGPGAGDANGDGIVDVNDILLVIGAWGGC